ncbi:MAG: ASKHA domain-containing protein [Ornithinimicrobium sp.]
MTSTDGQPAAVQVFFSPAGRRGTVTPGTTVLDAARQLRVDLDSVCGGHGLCGRCQVEVGARPGLDADPDRLSAAGPTELSYAGTRPLTSNRRLGCLAQIVTDVVIDVPETSQVHRQVVRKDAQPLDITIDPAVMLRYVEMAAPSMQDRTGTAQRLLDALAQQWNLVGLVIDPSVLPALASLRPEGRLGVSVAIREGSDVVGAWPGLRERLFGLAFDVGSTTIAGHLCDLFTGEILASSGRMNPQIAYGEDLMSRVSYVMMNPGGEHQLTDVVREALAAVSAELCQRAGIEGVDVLEVCIVGNPIMHHVVLGLDPTSLGSAPFALATTDAVTVTADRIGLSLHPGARVYLPPCMAGHVGADAAAMVLAQGPHHHDALTLLVDIGTNAEIVLGNRERLLAASSPTGPAFEGAQISGGQRAAAGAIERVRIDPDTLEPRIRVIGAARWSDQQGFVRSVQRTGITGICGSGIIEVVGELFLAGVIAADGTIVGREHGRIEPTGRTFCYRLWDDPPLRITQADVRAIQLAKAALYAGCRLLMDAFGRDDIEAIQIAGAFGANIDPTYAMLLGLIPDCDLSTVTSVGNAAGKGALMALLSQAARRDVEQATAAIEKIETAVEPAFQEHFVAALAIPHTSAPMTHLQTAVRLPTPSAPTTERRRSRRRAGTGS